MNKHLANLGVNLCLFGMWLKSNPDTRHMTKSEFLKTTKSSGIWHQTVHNLGLYITSLTQQQIYWSTVVCLWVRECFLYLSNLHQWFIHIDSSVAVLQIRFSQFVLLYKLCVEVPNGGKQIHIYKQQQTNKQTQTGPHLIKPGSNSRQMRNTREQFQRTGESQMSTI